MNAVPYVTLSNKAVFRGETINVTITGDSSTSAQLKIYRQVSVGSDVAVRSMAVDPRREFSFSLECEACITSCEYYLCFNAGTFSCGYESGKFCLMSKIIDPAEGSTVFLGSNTAITLDYEVSGVKRYGMGESSMIINPAISSADRRMVLSGSKPSISMRGKILLCADTYCLSVLASSGTLCFPSAGSSSCSPPQTPSITAPSAGEQFIVGQQNRISWSGLAEYPVVYVNIFGGGGGLIISKPLFTVTTPDTTTFFDWTPPANEYVNSGTYILFFCRNSNWNGECSLGDQVMKSDTFSIDVPLSPSPSPSPFPSPAPSPSASQVVQPSESSLRSNPTQVMIVSLVCFLISLILV